MIKPLHGSMNDVMMTASNAGLANRMRLRQPWRVAAAAAVLAAGLAFPGFARAQVEADTGPAPVYNVKARDHAVTRKIDLSIGKSIIVELPRDAKEVFVANPAVANAVVRSTRKLYIIGIKDGTTSVFAMDAEGRQIATLEIGVGRDLTALQQTLRVAMPRAQIDVQSAGDSILLTGTVNNASEATQAVDIAKAFVGVSSGLLSSTSGAVINSLTIRGRDQVMVKVTVAEVSRIALKQLGINSTGEWRIGNFRSVPSIDNPLSVNPQALSATAITAGLAMPTTSRCVRWSAPAFPAHWPNLT